MSDIIIDSSDTAALFVGTTDDGWVRFSITGQDLKVIAYIDLTPERAEDIARMALEAVEKTRPAAGGGHVRGVPPIGGGGGSWEGMGTMRLSSGTTLNSDRAC